jgi:hypothetical protein
VENYFGHVGPRESCKYWHLGVCKQYTNCNRFGHLAPVCRSKPTEQSGKAFKGCYECGDMSHFRKDCPKLKQQSARGRAFEMKANEATQDPSVVTGTFLVNNHFASILFDTGADMSFVSNEFKCFLGTKPTRLKDTFSIELANGKIVETGEVISDCTLELEGHAFKINLLPVELGSFDVIVGMDLLSGNQAEILCH